MTSTKHLNTRQEGTLTYTHTHTHNSNKQLTKEGLKLFSVICCWGTFAGYSWTVAYAL